MRKPIRLPVIVITALGAMLLSLTTALPAMAIYAPTSHDVVGVGSQWPEYSVDFGADGDTLGDPGYNSGGNRNKLVNFDATPSMFPCRASFPLHAAINGSTAGMNSLLDTTDKCPSFVDMDRSPTSAEAGQAVANGWQGLQQFVLGLDHIVVARDASASNAVPLSAAQLTQIYSCTLTTWNLVGGTSTDTIIPVIPAVGSFTRNTFLASLGNPALGSCVRTANENDPAGITGSPNPADAIEPFVSSWLNLASGLSGNTAVAPDAGGNGYFSMLPGVVALSGTPSDGHPLYDLAFNLSIVYRWTDQISTAGWQPGGTLNWARTLFCNPSGVGGTPFFQTAAGKTLIAEAGVDPAVQSCLTTPLT